MNWPFGDLQPMSYDLIMIDCAWEFETWSEKGNSRSPSRHYQTMPLDQIRALPVSYLARGDCVLFAWTTWPLMDQAPQIVKDWGFHYSTGGVWVKRTRRHGKIGFGGGYRVRSACEPWILATVGTPNTSKSHRNVIEGQLRQHSRKPDEAYRWCESYVPALRRADVFSRESREGWEACGLEAGKFDAAA